MKKVFVTLLTIGYLLMVVGVTVNKHFCGGKLSIISFFKIANEDDCCGEGHIDHCCKDEVKWLKISSDHHHHVAAYSFKPVQQLNLFLGSIYHSTFKPLIAILGHFPFENSPPNMVLDKPYYIKYQVFLI